MLLFLFGLLTIQVQADIQFLQPPEWGSKFNLSKFRHNSGYVANGVGRNWWIFPGQQNYSIESEVSLAVDSPNKRLKWSYGYQQGYQWTTESGTWLVLEPPTYCFYVNYTYDDYVGNLEYLRKVNTFDFMWGGPIDTYTGIWKDPSVCDGFASSIMFQRPDGQLVQYAFSSFYPCPSPTNATDLTPTLTWYDWHFYKWAPVDKSEAYWKKAPACETPLPLCQTTLPPPSRWGTMLEADLRGTMPNYLSPNVP